jgi:hypothetical protein
MDNELDPITNTEFSGPVGHEKKIHKTHWTVRVPLVYKDPDFDTGYEWVFENRRWKLHPKKNQQVAQGAEVK